MGMKRTIQRQKLESEEMDKATSQSLQCVDIETSTTHYSPSESTRSETSSAVLESEYNLTAMTQGTSDMMRLVDDDVPLERSHASPGLEKCSHRTDNRLTILRSKMIRLENDTVEVSSTQRSSPMNLTRAPLLACRAEEHRTTSASTQIASNNYVRPNDAILCSIEASRVSSILQRSHVPTSLPCPVKPSKSRAADCTSTILDDDVKLSLAWIHDDEDSSDDEVRSADSGIDGPSPSRLRTILVTHTM
eukprot:TRINITY_DN3682_c0_g3_i1.p1 TRINITY_DN3682_c0_g3~~TRINITY_DN3682_c0_g3_i1.p1  ORF type:complete len:258 (-),score=33.97 TRINITY_DN3682_c0_g3_i1:308-1051(-)